MPLLPDANTKFILAQSEAKVAAVRKARDAARAEWAEFAKERDAYAKLPQNPLAAVHRDREEKLKVSWASKAAADDAEVAELDAQLDVVEHELSIPALLRRGRHVAPKEDSDLREIRNMMLGEAYERDIAAMSVEERAAELKSLGGRITYNGPDPETTAKLNHWYRLHARSRLTGAAHSEYIGIFGDVEGALNTKFKARAAMLADVAAARQNVRAYQGYAHAIMHPDAELPTAAAMHEARLHGHLRAA